MCELNGLYFSSIVVLIAQSCPTLCDHMDYIACQAPLSVDFPGKSGLPCPTPGDLLYRGFEPNSLMSPALVGEFFSTSTTSEV